MIFHPRAVLMASQPAMLVMLRKSKKDLRPVYRKNCVWYAVIGRLAIIIMHLPVKAVRVSFDGVLPKMPFTVVNLVMPAKWTCTCDANAKNVD